MSNHANYNTRYNNQNVDQPAEAFSGLAQLSQTSEEEPEVSSSTSPVIEEPIVDEPKGTDYSNVISTPTMVTKFGVVDGCDRLNIREHPSSSAAVVGKPLAKSTRIVIDEVNSTTEFYKIYLSSGLEGFCMKEFIKLED